MLTLAEKYFEVSCKGVPQKDLLLLNIIEMSAIEMFVVVSHRDKFAVYKLYI